MKRFLVIALFLFLCPCSFANPIVNGGFETGNLNSWSSIGDVSVMGSVSGVPPAQGLYQAIITNSPALRGGGSGIGWETIHPISGNPSVSTYTEFESFFGIPWDANHFMGAWDGGVYNHLDWFSGIKTTFQANSGDQLSFQANLLYNFEAYPGILVLDDIGYILFGVSGGWIEPASSATYDRGTGYRSFSVPIATTGLHTLGFAAFTFTDWEGANALLIDGVSVKPIPEPTTILLLASGLIGLVGYGRKKFFKK